MAPIRLVKCWPKMEFKVRPFMAINLKELVSEHLKIFVWEKFASWWQQTSRLEELILMASLTSSIMNCQTLLKVMFTALVEQRVPELMASPFLFVTAKSALICAISKD